MGHENPPLYYAPIPPNNDDQNYVVLPFYPHHDHHRHRPNHNHRNLRRCLAVLLILLILGAAAYLLYPSDPNLTVVRLHLNRLKVKTSPSPSLDLSISLTLKVRNPDFFSLYYSSLFVSIGYRDRELGFVTSNGGHLRARGSSYVNATLELDGFEVLHDVLYLIEDLAKGSIPFDTKSNVKGKVGILFIQVPIKATISCEVLVNTSNQTIISQDCYPE